MDKRTTKAGLRSSPTWEGLGEWLRERVREFIQQALEEEVTEFLGRARYQRRAAVDAPGGTGVRQTAPAHHPCGHHLPAPASGAGPGGAV